MTQMAQHTSYDSAALVTESGSGTSSVGSADQHQSPTVQGDGDEHLRRAVSRVVRYMHDHLADPISADHIAQTAHFSKFHFSRVFQRMVGESPGRYLTRLRFERAEELLLTTNLKVIDISYEVGFASVGTFSTRFRRRYGVSPGDYRRRFRTAVPRERYQRPAPVPAAA